MKKLIKLFRRILMKRVKMELKEATSLDGCVDLATVDMIKALYAAYHGLDEAVEESDMVNDWANGVLSEIQGGLNDYQPVR